jgi:hypothetical protein
VFKKLNFTRKQRDSPPAGGCIFGQEKDATKGRTPCGFACGLPARQRVCALPRPRKTHNLEVKYAARWFEFGLRTLPELRPELNFHLQFL